MDTSPEGGQRTMQLAGQMGDLPAAMTLMNAYENSDKLANTALWRQSQININKEKAAESSQKAQMQILQTGAELLYGPLVNVNDTWDKTTELNGGDENKTVVQAKQTLMNVLDNAAKLQKDNASQEQIQTFKGIVDAAKNRADFLNAASMILGYADNGKKGSGSSSSGRQGVLLTRAVSLGLSGRGGVFSTSGDFWNSLAKGNKLQYPIGGAKAQESSSYWQNISDNYTGGGASDCR
jgi:hypothetical protein